MELAGPLAVIGHPIGHSLSPRIHNTALVTLGLEPVYEARDIPPERLAKGVLDLVSEGFSGFNVTIPHKEAIVPLLDRLADSARRVGAVNTVRVVRGGGEPMLEGHNTDVAGFLGPLRPFMERLTGCRVLVWGAGGAARAVVAAVLETLDPELVTLVARRSDAVYALAADLDAGGRLVAAPWPASAHAVDDHDLLVNTTPLGMQPNVDSSPAGSGEGLRRGQVVYDLVYRPGRTRLIEDAHRVHADVIGGLPMLVGQAAEAFRIWTGVDMPVESVLTELGAAP